MPADFVARHFAEVAGLLLVGFLVLVVVGTVITVRSRRESADIDTDGSGAHDDPALRSHLRAAEQAHRGAEAAHTEALRTALSNDPPSSPPPTSL